MMSELRQLDALPKQKEEFKAAYAEKYHQDVGGDLAEKLKGADERKMYRLVRKNPETAQEKVLDAYDYARDKNDDTVGSQVTRKLHSSAGDLAEDQIRQAMALLANAAAKGEVIAVDDPRITRLVKLTYDYSELFIKARSETADLVANIAINSASFVIPGGVSLQLLLLATGGGLLKVGIKEVISGDASVSDFFSGFANVGMNAFVL